MATEPRDLVLDRVEERLRCLSPTPPECSIFRVPDQLRKINEKAYEPEMLAIGPYHRGKDHLIDFEQYKTRYLDKLLQRITDLSLSDYVMAMRVLEERARKCYGGDISLHRDEFVEMMLLDGCFVVEVICKYRMKDLREEDDRIFKMGRMLPCIARDMFLLENQLPFFVLWKLFSMIYQIMPNNQTNYSFLEMIQYFFNGILPAKRCPTAYDCSIDEIKHLVGFIHDNWRPSPAGMGNKIKAARNSQWRFICCATEIQETGIKLQKDEDSCLFDIKFKNGVLKIPTLAIGDTTEAVFRNLIAHEQFALDKSPKHVVDYVKFMDCLINSSKDAELLRRRGIIDNWLGDDEVIAALINRLSDAVVLSDNFYYAEVFNEVNLHCSRRYNKWKAKLRHNYFNTPWAIISFLAAVVLLILTLLQAVFSILSYYEQK